MQIRHALRIALLALPALRHGARTVSVDSALEPGLPPSWTAGELLCARAPAASGSDSNFWPAWPRVHARCTATWLAVLAAYPVAWQQFWSASAVRLHLCTLLRVPLSWCLQLRQPRRLCDCALSSALSFSARPPIQADIAAALAAAREGVLAEADQAAVAVENAQLAALPDRFGVYVAREEKAGPFTFEEIDGITTAICKEAPLLDGVAPTASCNFLENADSTHVTVALVETCSEPVAQTLVAQAASHKFLACMINNVDSQPKIASVVAGNSVIHAPLPRGDFDLRDRAALRRHATAWLVYFAICMSTIMQSGHAFAAGCFALVAVSVSPRTPRSSVLTTLTIIVRIANGPLAGYAESSYDLSHGFSCTPLVSTPYPWHVTAYPFLLLAPPGGAPSPPCLHLYSALPLPPLAFLTWQVPGCLPPWASFHIWRLWRYGYHGWRALPPTRCDAARAVRPPMCSDAHASRLLPPSRAPS